MINSKKKGFTIVELVIVIAVIAVLAAVLIPTFSNLVKKANMSADQQAVRQMNTALAMADATKEIEDSNDAVDALSEAGFNSEDTLVPISKGYAFYFYSKYDLIVLVKEETKEVVFPEHEDAKANFASDLENNLEELVNLKNCVKYINAEVSSVKELNLAIQNGQKDITLKESISDCEFTVPLDADITIDLNGNTIDAKWTDNNKARHQYAFNVEGKLTLKNGTINARGVQAKDGGTLIIDEGTIINAIDNDGGAALYCWAGGKIIINNGEFNALNTKAGGENSAAALINDGGTVEINNGEFNGLSIDTYSVINMAGTMTINKATITSNCGGICNREGNTILSSDVEVTLTNGRYYCVYASGGKVEDKGASLTGGQYTYYSSANEGNKDGIIILPDGTQINPGYYK